MPQYVVIGTSPFVDTSVVVGPFRSPKRTEDVDAELSMRGWNTEVCELQTVEELLPLVNSEGGESSE